MKLIIEYRPWITDFIIDLMPIKINRLNLTKIDRNNYRVDSFWKYIGKLIMKLLVVNIVLLAFFYFFIIASDSIGFNSGERLYTSIAMILFFIALASLFSIPRTILAQPNKLIFTDETIQFIGISNKLLYTIKNNDKNELRISKQENKNNTKFDFLTINGGDVDICLCLENSNELRLFDKWTDKIASA